mmetsp:Transcript_38094/g.88646  ORF Transcript_38094/g.88646 Transcript_38094/m.88646 type:complete len:224 (-) Transcript_38094:940-1611(-)
MALSIIRALAAAIIGGIPSTAYFPGHYNSVLTTTGRGETANSVLYSKFSYPGSSFHRLATIRTALSVSPAELWNSYNAALETDPLLIKSVTAGVILGAADFTGQLLEDKLISSSIDADSVDTEIDYGRVARFAFFGIVLQAPWNHYYYLALDAALPPTPDPLSATTGIKVVIDQFVQAPVFTVLIFCEFYMKNLLFSLTFVRLLCAHISTSCFHWAWALFGLA